jgi:hypothetical protein
LSTSDESQMFSLSALTQSASQPSRPPRAEEEDSGLIDLARLRAEVDGPPFAFQAPPLFVPQPLVPLAVTQHRPAPRRRSPLPLLAAVGVAVVAAVAALAWLTSQPPPVLPAAELVAQTPVPLEAPVVSPTPKPQLATEPARAPEPDRPTPATEEPTVADPPTSLAPPKLTSRPGPRAKAPLRRERPKQAAPPAARKDACASCAPGDLRCHMRCRAH